jgi:hypothetical protein
MRGPMLGEDWRSFAAKRCGEACPRLGVARLTPRRFHPSLSYDTTMEGFIAICCFYSMMSGEERGVGVGRKRKGTSELRRLAPLDPETFVLLLSPRILDAPTDQPPTANLFTTAYPTLIRRIAVF